MPSFHGLFCLSCDLTSEYWDLFGSACYIEPKDGCIMSHPKAGILDGGDYGIDEVCVFVAKQQGIHHVVLFDTQEGYDFVTVSGVGCSGTSGQEGVTIESEEILEWESDSIDVASGFVICLVSIGTASLTSTNETGHGNHIS